MIDHDVVQLVFDITKGDHEVSIIIDVLISGETEVRVFESGGS